jgi:hypothetical protein
VKVCEQEEQSLWYSLRGGTRSKCRHVSCHTLHPVDEFLKPNRRGIQSPHQISCRRGRSRIFAEVNVRLCHEAGAWNHGIFSVHLFAKLDVPESTGSKSAGSRLE